MRDSRIKGRTLAIVLVVSLALNLFLAGFFATRSLFPSFHPLKGGPDGIVEHLTRALDTRDADTLRVAFQANQARLASLWGDLQSARRVTREKLAAEPFDRDALAAAMADTRTKYMAYYAAIQETVLQAAPNLTAEGRGRLWTGHKRK